MMGITIEGVSSVPCRFPYRVHTVQLKFVTCVLFIFIFGQVRGVVSFTFNMPKRRCMVRVTQVVSAKMLCDAIETSKTLTAEQIAKNKAGEEVCWFFFSISFTVNPFIFVFCFTFTFQTIGERR
jgi:hypothetical protein